MQALKYSLQCPKHPTYFTFTYILQMVWNWFHVKVKGALLERFPHTKDIYRLFLKNTEKNKNT